MSGSLNMFRKFSQSLFVPFSRTKASQENEEKLDLLTDTEVESKENFVDIVVKGIEQTSVPGSEPPLETFKRFFPDAIIQIILEYNLDDWGIIQGSPKLLTFMLQKEPQLSSIILLLNEIDRINTISLSLADMAKQRALTAMMALMSIISLLGTAGIGALIWYTRTSHEKFFALDGPIEQAKNIVFASCTYYPRSIYLNYPTCDYNRGKSSLIQDFGCSADLLKMTKFDELCKEQDDLCGNVVGGALGSAFGILALIITLYCLNKHNVSLCSDKASELSSTKYVPLPEREEIADLLDSNSNNLTGFTLGALLEELQTALKTAIQKWKKANPESGFDMILPCLEYSSSENKGFRNDILDSMIYGSNGYLTRHVMMFSGSSEKNKVVAKNTNTNTSITPRV